MAQWKFWPTARRSLTECIHTLEYSNPQLPEGINTGKEHPLKEFILLTTGVLGGLFIIFLVLGLIADKLAHYLPYSVEQDAQLFVMGTNDTRLPIVNYLQTMADKISEVQQLPDEMKINVHYADEDVINAYATLGGNVVMFRGLLEKLPNENALAMVMAHEIAHIKHRHPIRSLGSGVVVGIAVSVLSSGIGDDIINQFIGTTSTLSSFKFSREHETEADTTAIAAVKNLYGHLSGADALFTILQQAEGKQLTPEFLSTHPATESRFLRLKQKHNNEKPSPLPEDFKSWLVPITADEK